MFHNFHLLLLGVLFSRRRTRFSWKEQYAFYLCFRLFFVGERSIFPFLPFAFSPMKIGIWEEWEGKKVIKNFNFQRKFSDFKPGKRTRLQFRLMLCSGDAWSQLSWRRNLQGWRRQNGRTELAERKT